MKTKILLFLGCLFWVSLQPVSAQYVVGQWLINEGSGSTLFNSAPDSNNWDMTITGDPGLWGYWQPGAYAFANGGYAETALTAASAWTNGNNLLLKADFNVTGNLHDSGKVSGGGGVFGAEYLVPGGNSLGYNGGAFYTRIVTSDPAAPFIELDVSGFGSWSQALPTNVCDPNMSYGQDVSTNGGWNTAEWYIVNNAPAHSMTVQFRLNGTNVGGPVNVVIGYIPDFSTESGYTGTTFCIGAAAATYITFQGTLSNISLTASPITDPGIMVPPTNQNVLPGTDATFQAAVQGTAPLSLQWLFNGTNVLQTATINGSGMVQSNVTLTLPNVTLKQAGNYTLAVSNSVGTATATATLVVFVPANLQLALFQSVLIQGTVGFNYLIQYTDATTGANNWQTITNLPLPSSPYLWFDFQSPYVPVRTYKVVPAPMTATSNAPPAELVAHYTFDNTLADTTGNHPASINGTATYVTGVAGEGLQFDGVTNYLTLAAPTNIIFGSDYTISAWIQTTSTAQSTIICKTETVGWVYPGKQWLVANYGLYTDNNGEGSFQASFLGPYGIQPNDGQWHQAVCTYSVMNTPHLIWYLDTNPVEGTNETWLEAADVPQQIVLVGSRENKVQLYAGLMDDLQIYNQTLSPTQVQYLYNNPGSPIVPDPTITTAPQSQQAPVGTNVTMTAVAGGTAPFSYQWYFNTFTALTNATNATLTLTNVTTNQTGAYTLVVTNSNGTISTMANLVVYESPVFSAQNYPGLAILGTVGMAYQIQEAGALSPGTNWQTATNVILPSSPDIWFDLQWGNAGNRFYRAVASP